MHTTHRFMWSISESHVEFLNLNIFKGPRFNDTNHLDLSTHIKKTNTFQYLYYSSFYPRGVFRGLVKGEAIQFLRSNTHPFITTNLCSTYIVQRLPQVLHRPNLKIQPQIQIHPSPTQYPQYLPPYILST